MCLLDGRQSQLIFTTLGRSMTRVPRPGGFSVTVISALTTARWRSVLAPSQGGIDVLGLDKPVEHRLTAQVRQLVPDCGEPGIAPRTAVHHVVFGDLPRHEVRPEPLE